jgi:hypothetical protein
MLFQAATVSFVFHGPAERKRGTGTSAHHSVGDPVVRRVGHGALYESAGGGESNLELGIPVDLARYCRRHAYRGS